MSWPFAWAGTVRKLRVELAVLQKDHDRLQTRYIESKQEVYRIEQRVTDQWRVTHELQEARKAARTAQQALEKLEVRATQLDTHNAALRAALTALGGAVIELPAAAQQRDPSEFYVTKTGDILPRY